MKAQSACTSPLMAPKHRGRTWSDVPFVHCSIGAVNVYYIVFFPNSDSELKGSTSGQKIGTEDTTGARDAVPPDCRTNSYSRVKMQS